MTAVKYLGNKLSIQKNLTGIFFWTPQENVLILIYLVSKKDYFSNSESEDEDSFQFEQNQSFELSPKLRENLAPNVNLKCLKKSNHTKDEKVSFKIQIQKKQKTEVIFPIF